MLQVHLVLAAGFIVCRFDLDKMDSELVGSLAFDSTYLTITLTLTDSSLESFISLGSLCKCVGGQHKIKCK